MLEDRDPLPFGKCNVKIKTEVSQYSSCDANITSEDAKAKIKNWIKEAGKNIPEAIFVKDVGEKKRHLP